MLQPQQLPLPLQQQQQHYSRKKRFSQYVRKEIAQFFGVDLPSETEKRLLWQGRQKRLAVRRFGAVKSDIDNFTEFSYNATNTGFSNSDSNIEQNNFYQQHTTDRPDILPAQDSNNESHLSYTADKGFNNFGNKCNSGCVEHKLSVIAMIITSFFYIKHTINKRNIKCSRQWSRSFAHSFFYKSDELENSLDFCESMSNLQEEMFFDSVAADHMGSSAISSSNMAVSPSSIGGCPTNSLRSSSNHSNDNKLLDQHSRSMCLGERVNGWRISTVISCPPQTAPVHSQQYLQLHAAQPQQDGSKKRGNRISSQLLDGVLENSRRPLRRRVKLFSPNELDDRTDHRPFFTYWINTVQILILFLSLICYGISPVGFGVEQKTGQVLVTSLSLQTVQHSDQRNMWIGPRNNDLVHMGAKFATCMRRDVKIIDVLLKTRRQERETACCIRNDDSGCVQSSQADCSVRGLFPTVIIIT